MRRGRLAVVGLGPGDSGLLPPLARTALENATVVVGYKGYIDLVEAVHLQGKKVLSTGMMGEVERVNLAVDEAQAGGDVCMVCSGDPGIYAMAGLVLEALDTRGLLESVDFDVVPGVPAFCAAAAILGAPLMHDFAAVSLSDLLTPWEKIAKRLDAAADADFVIAIYNPRSKKRAGHLEAALEIIGGHRSPDTPVGIVGRAFRPGQLASIATLATLDVNLVDMQTIVIIGNSTTRVVGGHMLTPRGYHDKYDVGGGR
ncbi:MAG: precorrin-3B C(17)-methyltransferase [Proteobacteria bacterium]|nr:precorrin-3B C(17)-methyltransferase [Pseudomonadota bacterium]MBU1612416.1 precorrin-3B C(17)-methyltransferase [Pseudomonadota bacterium]